MQTMNRWRGRWRMLGFLGLVSSGGLLLTGLTLSGQGCQNQSGLYCQKPSDCQDGLVCTFPSGTPKTADTYGVCEPARHGEGETCLRSSDCQGGLRCSNEFGVFNDDERHGLCQTYDGGQPADLHTADLSTTSPPDLSNGADLAPPPDLTSAG